MEVTKWDFVLKTSALEAFLEELGRIDEFDDRVRGIREHLEEGARALEQQADQLELFAAEPGARGLSELEILVGRQPDYAAQAQDLRNEADRSRSEGAEWERQRLRVYVLRLVTAFEVYLRDYLIERACKHEALVRGFLRSKVGLEVASALDLGDASDRAERIAACVDETQQQFSNLAQANAFYAQWFGEGRGFLSAKLLAPPLSTELEKAAAVADLRILFQLRHILVHKSGVPNPKYHLELGKHYNGRLAPPAFETTDRAKGPEDVLSSPARDEGNATKRDDLYESLMNLARHIDAAYQ